MATLVSPEDRALGQEDYSQVSHSHQFVLASFKLDWDPFFLKIDPFWSGNAYPMSVPSLLSDRKELCPRMNLALSFTPN